MSTEENRFAKTMKAWVYDRYGLPTEVLGFRDVDVPSVADDEVLVRVRASATNPLDWHLMTADWLVAGEVRPVIGRGYDLANVPEALMYQGGFHAQGKVVTTV